MKVYLDKITQYTNELTKLSRQYNQLSTIRLCTVVASVYCWYEYIVNGSMALLVFGVLTALLFFLLMYRHKKIAYSKKFASALLEVNEEEASFLKRERLPFADGQEFLEDHHSYAYDLDIFGKNSLFQNLNRTATYTGKKTLAKALLTQLNANQIISNQEAVAELSTKLDFRQDFLALAKVSNDSKQGYDAIQLWCRSETGNLSKAIHWLSIILPIVFGALVLGYLTTDRSDYLMYLSYAFVINLLVHGLSSKKIMTEIAAADNVTVIIKQYSLLLKKIEQETFSTTKLKALQKQLTGDQNLASAQLDKLSDLFARMETVHNFVVSVVFNGIFLYNIQVLKSLLKWKSIYAKQLPVWIEVIGELEALNSLANLAYNNPDFVFPTLNNKFKVDFQSLSHPLLNPATRVGNEVRFHPESFIILTGSNMSGKSTFLRSLGVNMVLGAMGSVVCASKATLHPLPILVSMRLSDSLADSESYFFAEIKRLQQIMISLDKHPAFVLLDEILRGTNSDDKQNGTIEVVKKMIAKKAIGAIATHDIEVCLMTKDYPSQLKNQCFEVQIKQDELFFDYRLKDGVCQNKSATFLMKKLGVI